MNIEQLAERMHGAFRNAGGKCDAWSELTEKQRAPWIESAREATRAINEDKPIPAPPQVPTSPIIA